jgi:hypothetical protein
MNYTEKCQWLSDFYRQAAETGRIIQMQNVNGWMDSTLGPIPSCDPEDWRIKPEPDKIWLVWYPTSSIPQTFLNAATAKNFADRNNGTTQEITRPD